MIHVVGNAAVDTVIRVDRFPRPGETIVARGAAEDLGGKGANQAVVIARCGQNVRLVAAVGADAAGDRIRRTWPPRASRSMGCGSGPERATAASFMSIAMARTTIVSVIDAALDFDPIAADVLERWIAPGDWVVLQGNLRPSVTRACLALAKYKGAITVLNPSPTYPARRNTTGVSSIWSSSIAAKA